MCIKTHTRVENWLQAITIYKALDQRVSYLGRVKWSRVNVSDDPVLDQIDTSPIRSSSSLCFKEFSNIQVSRSKTFGSG